MKGSFSQTLGAPPALARFVLTTVIGLGLDLWTKALAVQYLSDGETVHFIPGWLQFEFIENPGKRRLKQDRGKISYIYFI